MKSTVYISHSSSHRDRNPWAPPTRPLRAPSGPSAAQIRLYDFHPGTMKLISHLSLSDMFVSVDVDRRRSTTVTAVHRRLPPVTAGYRRSASAEVSRAQTHRVKLQHGRNHSPPVCTPARGQSRDKSPLSGAITDVMLIVIALTPFTPVVSEPACVAPPPGGGVCCSATVPLNMARQVPREPPRKWSRNKLLWLHLTANGVRVGGGAGILTGSTQPMWWNLCLRRVKGRRRGATPSKT